jgi:hypothetical protein
MDALTLLLIILLVLALHAVAAGMADAVGMHTDAV